MDEFEFIGRTRALWESSPKDRVHVVELRSCTAVRLVTTLLNKEVLVELRIGRRKGLKEFLSVIDPSQAVLLDQLVVADVSSHGFLVPGGLGGLRREVQAGHDPVRVCESALRRLAQGMNQSPERYWTMIQFARDSLGSSVRTVSGGLPSLGKRHS